MNGKGALMVPRVLEQAVDHCCSKGFLIDLVCDLARKQTGEDAVAHEIGEWLDLMSGPLRAARRERNPSIAKRVKWLCDQSDRQRERIQRAEVPQC